MAVIKPARNYGIDFLRVIACYMVMQIHTGEFYYIGPTGNVLNTPDAHIVGWYNSFFRICVPLFVFISGFFLFPVGDTATFFKKRLSRVIVPFVLWCILYAFYYYFTGSADLKTTLFHILHIPVNYGTEIGHLWFVYMLIGIYLFAPLLSPWIEKADRRGMEIYLIIWGVALSLPFIHEVFPEVLGECGWNRTPLLCYFSGLLGYVILAAYIKKFHMEPRPWNYSVGIALIIIGYLITALVFENRLPTEKMVTTLELSWGFDTINVALMTTGVILIFKNITIKNTNSVFARLIASISSVSYGIYLAHIMVLNFYFNLLNKYFDTAAIKIPLIAGCTFITTCVLIKLLSLLPKSKWLVG
jgi:surface polysaccharide O-acyltransferase-like enzyme